MVTYLNGLKKKYSKTKGTPVLPVSLLPSQEIEYSSGTETHIWKPKNTFQALGNAEIPNDSDFF